MALLFSELSIKPRHESFTVANVKILQILQNRVMRTITGNDNRTPVHQLLTDSGWLSIHQLISYTTILTIYKIVKTGEPIGLANRLRREGEQVGGGRGRHELDIRVQGRLNVTREGLVYRGGVIGYVELSSS